MPRTALSSLVLQETVEIRRQIQAVYPLLEPMAAAFLQEIAHGIEKIESICADRAFYQRTEEGRFSILPKAPETAPNYGLGTPLPKPRRKPSGGRS